jgi:hypothetical protein
VLESKYSCGKQIVQEGAKTIFIAYNLTEKDFQVFGISEKEFSKNSRSDSIFLLTSSINI